MNTENNILIAKFLEWEFNEIEFIAPENTFSRLIPFNFKSAKERGRYFKSSIYKVNELLFHSSWDWLMEVVQRCLEICHDKMLNEWEQGFTDAFLSLDIVQMCDETVKFIKWHNENAAKKD